MSEEAARMNHVDRKVLDDVARVGWSDMAIFPTEDMPGIPFNYTVGLCEMDHPEILVMGMNNRQLHGILDGVVGWIHTGVKFKPDTYSGNVIDNLHVAWVEVLDVRGDYPLSMATRLFGDIKAIQLVWPDRKDRFPWHEDFDPEFRDYQELTGPWMGPMEVN